MSPGQTHVDEEEGHLQLGDPPATHCRTPPAKPRFRVDEVLVFTQPVGSNLSGLEKRQGLGPMA